MVKEQDRTLVPGDVLQSHVPAMRSLARLLARDADLAEDLVQDTLITAHRHPRNTDVPLTYWLSRVLRNHFKMWARAEARRSRRESYMPLWCNDDAATPECSYLQCESMALLFAAIESLPSHYKGALRSHYFDGLTSVEIAHRDAVPSATVRARLHRGLAILRTQLAETPLRSE